MKRWQGRVAVVTGASSGIGAAIAYQLQDAGVDVVALARRKDKIPEAVENARKQAKERGRVSLGKAPVRGQLHPLKCDVSKEDDILTAFKWIKDNVAGVDILVNNAGIPGGTKLTERCTDEWRNIINTNLLGLCICTREAIQQMKARGVDDGHIVHIGSRAGHGNIDLPGVHIYASTKHGVRVLTEGLRKELVAAKSKIRVTEVSPGAVQTELIDNLPSVKKRLAAGTGWTVSDFWTIPHLKAEDVADAVVYAISTPSHVQVHEIILSNVGENV